jgi:predicted nuclease of predicted toxin-antitoxin system
MKYAYQEKRVLLTYDKDFGELTVKDKLYPSAGIILFRLPMKNPALIAKYILDILTSRTDLEGHFSVVEEKKIRMRPLPYP